MTERSKQSGTLTFDELHRAWKNTHAPAGLARKIMTSVEDSPSRIGMWDLRWSVAAAVIVIVAIVSMVGEQPGEPGSPVVSLPVPSLAAINQAAGGKPSLPIPSLGNVKSVPGLPSIPSAPRRKLPEPTSSIHEEYDNEISNQTWIT